MAISFRPYGPNDSGTDVSFSGNLPGADERLICWGVTDNAASTMTGPGVGWTAQPAAAINNTADAQTMLAWTKDALTVGTETLVSITTSQVSLNGALAVRGDIDLTTVLDVAVASNNNNTGQASGGTIAASLTTVTAGCPIIAILGIDTTASTDATASFATSGASATVTGAGNQCDQNDGFRNVVVWAGVQTVAGGITVTATATYASGNAGLSLILLALRGIPQAAPAVSSRRAKKTRRPGAVGPDILGKFPTRTRRDFSSFSAAASGVAATGAVGTVAPSASVGLTGVAGTGAAGTVGVVNDGAVALAGVQAAGAVGTVTPSVSVPIAGLEATAAVGAVTPATTVLTTGSRKRAAALPPGESIFTINRFYRSRRNTNTVPANTAALSGVGAATAVGTVTPVVTAPLTGVGAAGAAGTLLASAPLEGSRRRAGGVHPGTGPYSFARYRKSRRNTEGSGTAVQAITGATATASVGAVLATRTIALTGVAGAGSVGSVSASQAGNASLTTVAGVTAVGSVAPGISVALAGVSAVGAAGAVSPLTGIVVSLTGVQATGEAGALQNARAIAVTGVVASATIGTVTGSTPGTWVPVNSSAVVEGWIPIIT